MLIFGCYTPTGMVRSHAPPLASLSECNRDGSTRFFTLNTDPSRIKQELFLFISPLPAPISSPTILSHFHHFSEAVFGFSYFPIISKTFKETNTVDQNVAGDILTKKFIHFLTFWNGANLRWISHLENISFQLKVDSFEYYLMPVKHCNQIEHCCHHLFLPNKRVISSLGHSSHLMMMMMAAIIISVSLEIYRFGAPGRWPWWWLWWQRYWQRWE